MKKTGFTLIELLAVIILLAVIALITYPIVDKVLKNAKEEAYNRSIENLENAARTYGTMNNLGYNNSKKVITIDTLKIAGLINNDDVKNPQNNEILSGCILYSWNDISNQYEYEYSEDCTLPATDAIYFTTETVQFITSMDIDYDACYAFLINNIGYSEEESDTLCSGGTIAPTPYDMIITNFDLKKLLNILILYNGPMQYMYFKSSGAISNEVMEDVIVISDYDNNGGSDVIIPKEINGSKVMAINKGAFFSKDLTSVSFKLATDLEVISDDAFAINSITSIDLSALTNLETIGCGAFDTDTITNFTGVNGFTMDNFNVCS